jgi:ribosomal protein S18 acetylase RimI-like enzyme
VGSRLLESGLRWLRSQGYERVVLNVAHTNPARSLYRRAGFTTFSESMELDLSSDPRI